MSLVPSAQRVPALTLRIEMTGWKNCSNDRSHEHAHSLVYPRLQRVAALHVAAREGKSAAIRKLVSLGANLDGQNDASWTPAFCALHAGHFDSLWLLLELGADPNASGQVHYEKCTRTPAFSSLLLDTTLSAGRANSTASGNF